MSYPAGRPPWEGCPAGSRKSATTTTHYPAFCNSATGAILFIEADRREIALRRGPHNRLGFAYQVAFVRVLGRFPKQAPARLLHSGSGGKDLLSLLTSSALSTTGSGRNPSRPPFATAQSFEAVVVHRAQVARQQHLRAQRHRLGDDARVRVELDFRLRKADRPFFSCSTYHTGGDTGQEEGCSYLVSGGKPASC